MDILKVLKIELKNKKVEHFFITNHGNEKIIVEGSALAGGGVINAVNIKIMDTVKKSNEC